MLLIGKAIPSTTSFQDILSTSILIKTFESTPSNIKTFASSPSNMASAQRQSTTSPREVPNDRPAQQNSERGTQDRSSQTNPSTQQNGDGDQQGSESLMRWFNERRQEQPWNPLHLQGN
ncbi:hypothetical protein P154DRAFT_575075 [Amniculicola lignicola CBS 123094]|uniref:Uncharacterized protein n=1 Tax=Amniculicola lignicola CBS 123094 TaxID=1392246 RepID=A0A6A5WKN5_9PLEO|nr:hypothetical protein P154DRAFT_575075 [Amniculicola lignicola CBS 123094]